MPTVERTLINPGKRRRARRNPRRMSLKQKAFFGKGATRRKAQAALKRARKRHNAASKVTSNPRRRRRVVAKRRHARKRNVGTILTVYPALGGNPGKRRRKVRRAKRSRRSNIGYMATAKNRSRRRRHNVVKNRSRRRRAVSVRRRHRRRSNPVIVVRRNRSRRRNYGRRRYVRRRNPGMLTGTTGKVLGVIGGATLTSLLMGFVPAQFNTGFFSYISTGIVAVLQGKLVGKISKSQVTGDDFMVGGLTFLALKILKDFIPGIPLGISGMRGMGLIAPSSFYVPQVNAMNSMGSFVLPSAVARSIPAAAPAGMHGMGNVRRMGRVR